MSTTTTVVRNGARVDFVSNPWHLYRINGTKVPSSTGIGKQLDRPTLREWYAAETSRYWRKAIRAGAVAPNKKEMDLIMKEAKLAAPRTRDKAAKLGTEVHEAVEKWAVGMVKGINTLVKSDPHFEKTIQLERWFHREGVDWVDAERISCSVESMFAGTVDAVTYDTRFDVVGVGDLKTGSTVMEWDGPNAGQLYITIRMQLASYVHMLHEEGVIGDPILAPRRVWHLPAKGGELKTYDIADKTKPYFSDYNQDLQRFLSLREFHRHNKGY